MDPVTIGILAARFLVMAVQAGVEVRSIIEQAKHEGGVPDAVWDGILERLDAGENWIHAELERRE